MVDVRGLRLLYYEFVGLLMYGCDVFVRVARGLHVDVDARRCVIDIEVDGCVGCLCYVPRVLFGCWWIGLLCIVVSPFRFGPLRFGSVMYVVVWCCCVLIVIVL